MTRLRFLRVGPVVSGCLATAMAMLAPNPVVSQSAPPAPARLEDILVSQQDGVVSILVKLSQQPTAASAHTEADDLLIDIDGLAIAAITFDPPKGVLVAHVKGEPDGDGGSRIRLSGAALETMDSVVYRNAVLIQARLMEPKLTAAESLMAPSAVAGPATPPVTMVQAASPIVETVAPATPSPEIASASPPVVTPVALATPPTTIPADVGLTAANLAGVTAERCAAAPAALEKDSWNLPALGDHALCLLQAGKTAEAKNRLDQLAAFQPDDWRVALGRADLAVRAGDVAAARTLVASASLVATDELAKAALARAVTALAPAPEVKATN